MDSDFGLLNMFPTVDANTWEVVWHALAMVVLWHSIAMVLTLYYTIWGGEIEEWLNSVMPNVLWWLFRIQISNNQIHKVPQRLGLEVELIFPANPPDSRSVKSVISNLIENVARTTHSNFKHVAVPNECYALYVRKFARARSHVPLIPGK